MVQVTENLFSDDITTNLLLKILILKDVNKQSRRGLILESLLHCSSRH